MSVEEDVRVKVQTVGHEPQNLLAQLITAQEECCMAVLEIVQDSRGWLLQGGQNENLKQHYSGNETS